MATFLIFQGSDTYSNLVGTIQAGNLETGLKLVAHKLSKVYESVEIDSELSSIFFTAYFPKNQEQNNVHQLDITSPSFAKEMNAQGGNYVWSAVYYTIKDSDDYAF